MVARSGEVACADARCPPPTIVTTVPAVGLKALADDQLVVPDDVGQRRGQGREVEPVDRERAERGGANADPARPVP